MFQGPSNMNEKTGKANRGVLSLKLVCYSCLTYMISHEIWTWFCCALFCCGYIFVSCRFMWSIYLNTLRPKSSGRYFPADIFKCIFLNENMWISIKISQKFVPEVHLTISQHWFRWWLGAGKATSHYMNQWWVVYWRIYASLGPNEF